jgi:PAS domain S-box-containing protein
MHRPTDRQREDKGDRDLRSETFETLVDRAPLGVYFVDADFRVQEVNPIAEPIFAGFPGGAIGEDFAEVLHTLWDHQRAEQLVGAFRRTLETGEPYHVPEFADRRADLGVTEFYDWRIERLLLPDGRYGVVCYFRDISEEVQARRALAASEKRYRALFESISEGFCVIELIYDEEGKPVDYVFVETNPAFQRHTGLADPDGKRVLSLVPDLERHWVERYARVAANREAARFVEHSAAMRRWFEVDAFPMEWSGGRQVALLFTDITARKEAEDALRESEERLRMAKAAAGLGTHDFSPVSGEIGWDERTREIWGLGPGDPVDFEAWRAGIHPEDRDSAEAAVAHALDPAGDGVYSVEYRVISRADGRTRWVHVTGTTTFREGRAVRLVGTVHDISDRKRTEEALKEADRRKDEFLAMLSHELRSPLAAIRSGVDVLEGATERPDAVERITAAIDRQSAHLVRIIDDLLEVSRVSLGKVQLARETVDLVETVRQVADDLAGTCSERDVGFAAIGAGEPVLVDADPVRIGQVVNNLLHNACKFTPPGGRIGITVAKDDGEAVFRVSDTGIGMTEEQLDEVFELFVQGEPSRGDPSEGLGIGLPLARSIVELHGGSIEAASAGRGQGSEFVVRLPLSEIRAPGRQDTPAGEPPSARGEKASCAAPATGRRIVVAEDNRDALYALTLLLQTRGHEVEAASDGVEALEKVRERRPQVALLDIDMPGLDGYEVARRIREETWGREMLLVAMTGWGQEKDKRLAREAGFDAHLTKPADLDALQEILDGARGGGSVG